MKIELKKQPNRKYTLIGEFEIGESKEYVRRVLVSNISKKKAEELKLKYTRWYKMFEELFNVASHNAVNLCCTLFLILLWITTVACLIELWKY